MKLVIFVLELSCLSWILLLLPRHQLICYRGTLIGGRVKRYRAGNAKDVEEDLMYAQGLVPAVEDPMTVSELVTKRGDGDCGGRFTVAVVFACVERFTKGRSRASFSLRKPGFRLPPSLAATPRSGAEVGPGEALGAVVTIIERRDSGKDGERVMGECEDSGAPVGSILSRSGAEDGGFGGSEGVRRPALCWRGRATGGEGEERGGTDVEVSGVWCIPEATTGSGEVTGMWGLSVVV